MGFLGLKDDSAWSSFVITGLPWKWGPKMMNDWLTAQGWTVKDGLSPPRAQKQGWLFGGKPPDKVDPNMPQIYQVDGKEGKLDSEIVIQKRIRNGKRWKEKLLANSSFSLLSPNFLRPKVGFNLHLKPLLWSSMAPLRGKLRATLATPWKRKKAQT